MTKDDLKRRWTDEFRKLADASGLNNADIARACGVTPQHVGYLRNNGDATASEHLLKAFQLFILQNQPQTLASLDTELREDAPVSEAEIWRRRAITAETRLNDLREGLRDLLSESNPSRPEPKPAPNSKRPSMALTAAKKLLSGRDDSPGKS